MGFLKSKLFRQLLVVGIIVLTFGIFIWYGASHPKIISTVLGLNPIIIVFLAIAYSLTILANGIILHFSLSYVRRKTSILDNILLTGYSSIVNFFGPLQSGPGFRAVYLKKKYGIEIKKFLLATFVFYLFFGVINLIIVIIAGLVQKPEWRPAIIITALALALLSPLLLRLALKKERIRAFIGSMRLKDKNFWLIGAGAVGLTLSSGLAYFIELNEISGHIGLGQVLVYTATANLSLFVSLTPGAIGFREAFLIFSQQLHTIPTTTIFAASVIDRAFYVAFLLVMFIVLLAINGRKKFLPSLTRSNQRRQ